MRTEKPLKKIRPAPAVKRGIQVPLTLLIAGVLFIAGAIIMEHPVFSWTDGKSSLVFSNKALISLMKEIGFALMIAWGVSWGIERRARERDEEHVKQTRGRIAQDVVHAVYGLEHDANYVRTVIEQTLRSKVVRDFFDCDYTIECLSQEEAESLEVACDRFVKLTLISKYSFQNVSNEPVEFDVRYSLAARFGAKVRNFARIQKLSLNDQWLSDDELCGGDRTEPSDAYKTYCWRRTIAPKDALRVVVVAVSIKELSDNEVWGNYHATMQGMDLVAHVKVPGLRYGLRTLTSTKANQTYQTEGSARWEIKGPILPNESVVFWWRVPEDDGEPSEPVPSEAS